MFAAVLRGCLQLVTVPCCPLCEGALEAGAAADRACAACRDRLELPEEGIQGCFPLPWWSLGLYHGPLRQWLLRQRQAPRPRAIAALARSLQATLPDRLRQAVLVPIPSWKQRGGNPLPDQVCDGVGLTRIQPLRRSRPTLGQHHLNRTLRLLNQRDGFATAPEVRALRASVRGRPLLLVDDILTTGATAMAAAATLGQAGFLVEGLLCLARTPAPGCDLGSASAVPAARRDSSVGRAGD